MLRRYQPKTPDEITELHEFGWRIESALQPILEDHLGETLVKTERRYDAIDFLGERYQVELKARRSRDKSGRLVKHDSYSEWLLPASKVNAAAKSPLRTTIFYYFEGDETLWQIWTDEIDWSKVTCKTPFFHTDRHYYVPKDLWKKVDGDYGFDWNE